MITAIHFNPRTVKSSRWFAALPKKLKWVFLGDWKQSDEAYVAEHKPKKLRPNISLGHLRQLRKDRAEKSRNSKVRKHRRTARTLDEADT